MSLRRNNQLLQHNKARRALECCYPSTGRDPSKDEGTDFRSTLSNKIEPFRDQDRMVVEPSPS
jgi:hypothetical protein